MFAMVPYEMEVTWLMKFVTNNLDSYKAFRVHII
jgi:hypothetical protein